MIRPQMFSGELWMAPPGEVVFESAGKSDSQTVFGWVVPVGVYEVCMLGVSSHRSYQTRISRGGADLLNTCWAFGTNGAVGGDGGDPGNGPSYNGAGGAGGYSGTGGMGGTTNVDAWNRLTYDGGLSGSGGGGGGGYSGNGGGGGVGIYGQGPNGAGSWDHYAANGQHGSDLGPLRGGAGTINQVPSPAGKDYAKPGGNLRYRNAVPVTPGETLTITLDHWIRDNAYGVGAVVRILWGPGRSFPNNAAKVT